MKYPVRGDGGHRILCLQGEVDLAASPQARRQILDILKSGSDLMVDLTAVEYIDSSGIASLVEGYQYARNKGLEFYLFGVSDAAMRVLKLAKLDQVLPIHRPSESAPGAS